MEKHLEHPEVSILEREPGEIRESYGEPLSEQRTGAGTRTRWFYTYKGKPFVWDDVVTEWDPQKKVAWKTTSKWDMRDSFTLYPIDEGTRLVYDMTYRLPYGPLGWLYGKIVLEPRMKRHLNGVLRGIKKLCENPIQ